MNCVHHASVAVMWPLWWLTCLHITARYLCSPISSCGIIWTQVSNLIFHMWLMPLITQISCLLSKAVTSAVWWTSLCSWLAAKAKTGRVAQHWLFLVHLCWLIHNGSKCCSHLLLLDVLIIFPLPLVVSIVLCNCYSNRYNYCVKMLVFKGCHHQQARHEEVDEGRLQGTKQP